MTKAKPNPKVFYVMLGMDGKPMLGYGLYSTKTLVEAQIKRIMKVTGITYQYAGIRVMDEYICII